MTAKHNDKRTGIATWSLAAILLARPWVAMQLQ